MVYWVQTSFAQADIELDGKLDQMDWRFRMLSLLDILAPLSGLSGSGTAWAQACPDTDHAFAP